MTFYEQLMRETSDARRALMAAPVIADCLVRRVSRETYAAFLAEAYQHVRHTVPLLMACGSRLPTRLEWLRKCVVDYIDEEYGHEQWIWNDLQSLGVDADALIARGPSTATELMVSYAYDTVHRGNPVAFFGMVFVLEGASVALATQAAHIIAQELELPPQALSYLLSHGSVDVRHIEGLTNIMNRLEDGEDKVAVLHSAGMFFELYRRVFADLPRASVAGSTRAQREVA